MKPLVIYHRADFDGIFCCEIAKQYYGEDAEYLGWNHGDPVPEVSPDREVMLLDLSIESLMSHPGLVWIDHHASAIAKYAPEIDGWRIDGVAACRLVWQWFFRGRQHWLRCLKAEGTDKADFVERRVKEPWAVRLAGEYDVWDKRDPDAELFQHGLRSQDLDFAAMLGDDERAVQYVRRLLEAGQALQYARTKENASVIKSQGFTVRFEGLTFLACNAARFNSLLFKEGLRPEHDGCLGFCWDGKNWRWKVSMYGVPGKPELDFSPIAVRYGGGGHRQACGFQCDRLPFELGKELAA